MTDPMSTPRVVLEAKQPFSRSLIWALQRNYYQQLGIHAWATGAVPHYITNNPFIAETYARVVFGWLRDWHASGAIDASQPVYLIELGTGLGRFAFQFMTQFFRLLDQSPLRQIPVTYVMTDFVGQNAAFWHAHPALQPFIATGRVDFADFDAEQYEQPLYLQRSGQILTPDSVKNPVAVLANYFFDVLPADLFRIRNGALYESLATVTSSQPEPDLADPTILQRMDISYNDVETVVTADYYDDLDLNQVLFAYPSQLGDTVLLFPALAMQLVRHFNRLATGRLLLLLSEKGHERLTDLANVSSPGIAVQGGFSLMVNLHALIQYVYRLDGDVIGPVHRSQTLYSAALVTGKPRTAYFDTRLAVAQTLEQNGPSDFFLIKKLIESHYADLALDQILAYLRQSQWDGYVFLRCFPTLIKRLESYPAPLREDVHAAVYNVWQQYFHVADSQDLPFCLATILHLTEYYTEAIALFDVSLALYGPDANTFYNEASCYYELGQLDRALDYLNKTLAITPDFASAHAMRQHIESQLSPGPSLS